ncbi:O-antigen ligase family protein [Maribacter sp. LLG6340-A2]|uniref:O-antigen ligase family protein n=1 Tax=Maribacter sp. LLG6340-A2 TaxID=3160834 RepID=UPI00386BBB69
MNWLTKNILQYNTLTWSAIFFSFSFGLGIALNSIGFFLFCASGVIYSIGDIRKKIVTFNGITVLFLIIGYFTLVVLREVIANVSTAPEVVFYYLAFLFIPAIFLFQSKRLLKHHKVVLMAFVMGMVFNAFVNLSFGFYRGVFIRDNGVNFWYFTYNFLAEPFGIQPIYLGCFYVIALLITFHFKTYIKSLTLFYCIIILLIISVFLLAARNAILSMMILIPLYLSFTKKITVKNGILLLCIFAICFISALQNPVVKNRILKVTSKGNFYSGSSLRNNIWQSAISASKENFIWGSGEKKASLLLFNEFDIRDLKTPLKYKYHSHNQFLNTLIQYGAVGSGILIVLFIGAIWITWRDGNYLGFVITVLFLFTMLTESIFTRQWGVFSFPFFIILLVMKKKSPN